MPRDRTFEHRAFLGLTLERTMLEALQELARKDKVSTAALCRRILNHGLLERGIDLEA